MTDREMLELAAKAHGKEIDLDRYDDEMGFIILGISRWWNPLTNDGDAFRLMVKLRLTVSVWSDGDHASAAMTLPDGVPPSGANGWRAASASSSSRLATATRRAITRAAAAIQEAKEGV